MNASLKAVAALVLGVIACAGVAAAELKRRRAAIEAKGKDAWKPAAPRPRKVSKALRAYAAFATSAAGRVDRG